jgi:uncharacterized protein YeaO (DUF488 family)
MIKRAYEPADGGDGYRVLVDRLWPRGVKKENLQLDEWCKDVAPSTELREWFKHDPAKFKEFTTKYEHELAQSDAPQELLKRAGHNSTITLVYAAHDAEHNHALVLRSFLDRLR